MRSLNVLKVVLKQVGQPAVVRELVLDTQAHGDSARYEAVRAALGCEFVESVGIGPGVSLICDEDGIAKNAPENECGIRGHFLFLSNDPDAGDWRSLDAEECRKAIAWCDRHKDEPHKEGFEIHSYPSPEAAESAIDAAVAVKRANWDSL